MVIAEGIVTDGDPLLLPIVLEKLLSNAWKFTGDAIAPRIEFGTTIQPDGTVAYFLRDNGVGFEMAYADGLFVAFHRQHHENEFPGIGIGLASVQRIVRRHGGEAWAEAALGQGATFYFTTAGSPRSQHG